MKTKVDKDGFCIKCKTRPCQCKELQYARKHGGTHCCVCGVEFSAGFRGGYSGSDMCGVCCMGSAELLDEQGETW